MASPQELGAQGHGPQGSPQGSPYGSPSGQPDPGLLHPPGGQPAAQVPQGNGLAEMAQLARMVADAATAAADAARAATHASTSTGGDKKKDWYRLIPRPSNFAPTDREQEVSLWRDWYWGLRQYLLVVDGAYEDDLAYVERSENSEVDWDLLDSDEQQRGRFLYSLLSTLLSGRLLSLVRNIEKSNGLEALRHLLLNCQPKARSRTMSMLQGIMGYPAFSMKSSIIAQVVRLEENFAQFEKLGGKLTDEMKAAVLLKCISGPLKVHLNLSLTETTSYSKIREVIQAYDTATTKWSDATITTFPLQPGGDPNGPAPMEIDRIKGGKSGGKGKAKGKDTKGKSKGKDQKGKGKGSNQNNQWSSSSTTTWTQSSKSNAKGDGKPSGDKNKGKSKGKDSNLCFNCGRPGHMAKDCWRIRQVGGCDPAATVMTTATGQESIGPSASQSPVSNMAVKRVEAVQDGGGSSSSVVFDLRSSTADWYHVRMVKFFYIDDEDEQVASVRSATSMDEKEPNYELDENEVAIIIDSGADAPIFPASMIHCGRDHNGRPVALQDAQGRRIPVVGQKSVSVLLEANGGTEIELRDNVVNLC
eukprot:s1247_g7.t1